MMMRIVWRLQWQQYWLQWLQWWRWQQWLKVTAQWWRWRLWEDTRCCSGARWWEKTAGETLWFCNTDQHHHHYHDFDDSYMMIETTQYNNHIMVRKMIRYISVVLIIIRYCNIAGHHHLGDCDDTATLMIIIMEMLRTRGILYCFCCRNFDPCSCESTKQSLTLIMVTKMRGWCFSSHSVCWCLCDVTSSLGRVPPTGTSETLYSTHAIKSSCTIWCNTLTL